MQKSFDTMNTQMNNGNFNYSDLFNMPGVSMIDLGSFQNQISLAWILTVEDAA